MLLNGTDLIDTPILSLQTGAELARTTDAIINPHQLSVIAYEVTGPHLDQEEAFLRIDDVRELSAVGMIIDSNDEFVEIDDVVRLKAIYELRYGLVGKPVYDDTHKKVGKVIEYVIDSGSFVIQQLIIKRPFLKSLNDAELIVHRSQIVEVTDDAIVIKSARIKHTAHSKAKAGAYVNPFRPQATAKPVAESSNSDTTS